MDVDCTVKIKDLPTRVISGKQGECSVRGLGHLHFYFIENKRKMGEPIKNLKIMKGPRWYGFDITCSRGQSLNQEGCRGK